MLQGTTGATSSSANITRTGPESNPSLCGHKPAINSMSHGTVFGPANPRISCIKTEFLPQGEHGAVKFEIIVVDYKDWHVIRYKCKDVSVDRK